MHPCIYIHALDIMAPSERALTLERTHAERGTPEMETHSVLRLSKDAIVILKCKLIKR